MGGWQEHALPNSRYQSRLVRLHERKRQDACLYVFCLLGMKAKKIRWLNFPGLLLIGWSYGWLYVWIWTRRWHLFTLGKRTRRNEEQKGWKKTVFCRQIASLSLYRLSFPFSLRVCACLKYFLSIFATVKDGEKNRGVSEEIGKSCTHVHLAWERNPDVVAIKLDLFSWNHPLR